MSRNGAISCDHHTEVLENIWETGLLILFSTHCDSNLSPSYRTSWLPSESFIDRLMLSSINLYGIMYVWSVVPMHIHISQLIVSLFQLHVTSIRSVEKARKMRATEEELKLKSRRSWFSSKSREKSVSPGVQIWLQQLYYPFSQASSAFRLASQPLV